MNNKEKLESILKTMDIPQIRKNDMSWLMRNIQINNHSHPQIKEAIQLIKTVIKEGKDNE